METPVAWTHAHGDARGLLWLCTQHAKYFPVVASQLSWLMMACSMRLTLHLLIVQGFLYVKARGDNCAAEQSGAPYAGALLPCDQPPLLQGPQCIRCRFSHHLLHMPAHASCQRSPFSHMQGCLFLSRMFFPWTYLCRMLTNKKIIKFPRRCGNLSSHCT